MVLHKLFAKQVERRLLPLGSTFLLSPVGCYTIGKNIMQKRMIYTNTQSVPGREITEILGVVTGNVVQTKHMGKDIMAAFRSMVGGEISGYTQMLTEARQIAISRMVTEARSMDADAIVNLRFTTSSIMSNASEILAYGTAVKLRT